MLLCNVYLLQPKTLGSLKKTEASLRSFNLSLSLSLSLVRSKNITKSVLNLFATSSIGELVLDLNEFDASKEDLESGVHQITM